ncbi:MAG: hypothetical protein NDI82_11660, partial [Anaeromyxobacteraceae bacterium]|nr:hypothetical protein [Anaeromyxobacteraceae bacterium]
AAIQPGADVRFIIATEAGPFFGSRVLAFTGTDAGSSTLRGFEANAVAGARLHLSLFPLARRGGWGWAGLGVTADWDRSIGLHADAPTGGQRPVERTRWRAGLAWRSPPLAGRLVLAPSLAYEAWGVVTKPAIDGLPDADLAGVRLALGAELAVARRLTLLAGVGWVRWHQARDLVAGDPAFFPGGSAWGLAGEAGLAVAVRGPLSARLVLEHAATRYSLRPDPSGRYAASQATDSTTEVRALARLTY